MILKSICLQGFKSFPERTLIRFHEGVTAIVGPNGSGKSNVTDAIRWVLGEQSMKTLRSSKMEELIFSGTQTRRPLSYAEVTLTMDNEDRSLPLDYPEIRVCRRVYRSGESEYLINDSRCRLKDINELFLDTGIGRDGYSMIGQGRVDDILSGKAELRRKMLDEASGITKYKMRREESQKKLAHTEQNLIRLNDIMQEIEKQKGPLERQAKKAQTFLKLRDELKSSDLALLYYDIDRKEEESKKLRQDLVNINQNIADAETHKGEIMAEVASLREVIQEVSGILSKLQAEEAEAGADLSRHEQELALAVQQIEQINLRQQRYLMQSDELKSRMTKLNAEEAEKKEEFEALDEKARNMRDLLGKAEALYQQAERNMQADLLLQQSLLEDEADKQLRLDDLRRHMNDEEKNREVLKAHLEMLDKDLADLSMELNSGESESNRLSESLAETKAELSRCHEKSAETEKQREALRRELADKEQAMQKSLLTIDTLRYQLKTQHELAESYEGYSYPVKQLMENIGRHESKVYGPLADLLQVPAEYEAAVESVLGASAQHIVVEDDDTAKRMINILKQKRWGRATFLPLNRVKEAYLPREPLEILKRMPGYRGPADELVSYEPEIRKAVSYALGRSVVADTLDHALEMARRTDFRIRLADLEGDLLNPGGSMSGGSRKQQNSGILSRQRQLDELGDKISEAEVALENQKKEISELKARGEEADGELGRISLEIARLSREEILLNTHLNQYEQSKIRLRSKHEQNRADYERLVKEQSEAQSSLDLQREKEAASEAELEAIAKQKKDLSLRLEKLNKELTEAGEHKNALKLEMMQSEERGLTAKQLLQRVRQELSQIREELDMQDLDRQRDSAEVLKLTNFVETGNESRSRFEERVRAIKDKVRDSEERRREANESLAQSSEDLAAVGTHLTKLGQEQGRLEQRSENSSAKLMELRGRLWEEYACTFADKDKWYQEDLDPAASREVVKTLRQQIKNLGSVNVQAIEESKEINERFEFMDKQRQDILEAQKDLEQIIADITSGMQKQFKESFSFINEQFNITFKQLFGGGEAELVLEDKSDILNSAIDIKVSPPGKRLQNMLALSGGERCLTAIALLFAIQKLNPSPFCVLDEVEAALDEANVFRFTDYITANSDKTQYILVTHRRGTMEAARMIYGVTMQERGVSQIISVRLDEE